MQCPVALPALCAGGVVEGAGGDDNLRWLPGRLCGPGRPLPPPGGFAQAQVAALQAQQITTTHPAVCQRRLHSLNDTETRIQVPSSQHDCTYPAFG